MRAGAATSQWRDAVELIESYRAGTTTPGAVLEASLDAIASGNEAIRAFVEVDARAASDAARASNARWRERAPRGPLDGVPIAVKANIAVEGLACTAGVGAWRDRVAVADAPVVARLRAAGAVIVGTVNMHEGALGATTDNPFFGRTDNPLAPGFTPGGSSGGSGAAVAAGFVPIALGTDTMGSVRIPAAYCGVMGLKPTAGLISNRDIVPLSPTLDCVGALATSARDLAVVTAVMAWHDPHDPMSVAAPDGWRATADRVSLGSIVLGLPDAVARVDMEPGVRNAFDAALERLSGLGARIAPVRLDGWEPSRLRRDGLMVSEAECAELHCEWVEAPEGVTESFRKALIFGRDASAMRLAGAQRRIREVGAIARRALMHVDALVMPTAPQRAFRHGEHVPPNQADFTALASFARLPAMSLPAAAADGGLPAGLQVIGRPFGEGALVAIAAAFSGR